VKRSYWKYAAFWVVFTPGAQVAENIARLKKQAMAEAAEAALSGKGWLPSLLRRTP
jgi:hypothetical protein